MDAHLSHVVRLHGTLTIVACTAQQKILTAAVQACGRELVLDLSEVEAIDGAGAQLLIAARRSLSARHATLRLRRASKPVADLLALHGLQTMLPCEPAASESGP